MNIKVDKNKKFLVLNENTNVKPSRADIISAVEGFISEFPDNAVSWIDATQELADMARYLSEEATVKLSNTVSKTPAEYNVKHKTFIRKTLKEIDEHTLDLFYQHYSHWFIGTLNESEESEEKDIKELVLTKSKQFKLDCGLFFETINSGKLDDNKLGLKYHRDNSFDATSFIESVRKVVLFAEYELSVGDIERLEAHYNKYQ